MKLRKICGNCIYGKGYVKTSGFDSVSCANDENDSVYSYDDKYRWFEDSCSEFNIGHFTEELSHETFQTNIHD